MTAENLRSKLENIRRKIREGFEPENKGDTLVGFQHFENVEKNLKKLLDKTGKGSEFSDIELFLLNASAYLHDLLKPSSAWGSQSHGGKVMKVLKERLELYGLDNRAEAIAIGWISAVHSTRSLDKTEWGRVPKKYAIGAEEVNLRNLAAIFLLADTLDTTTLRAPEIMRHIHYPEEKFPDEKTKGKWLGRQTITGWVIKEEMIVLQAYPKSLDEKKAVLEAKPMMEKELSEVKQLLEGLRFPCELELEMQGIFLNDEEKEEITPKEPEPKEPESKPEEEKEICELSSHAQKLFEEKRYAEAIEKGQEALELDSENSKANEVIQEAKRILEELEENKRKIDELNTSAQQLYDEGKYREAIVKWEEVLNLDPENKTANDGIDKANEAKKKLIRTLTADARKIIGCVEAIAKWQRVQELNPENPEAIEGIEKCKLILSEMKAAQHLYDEEKYQGAIDKWKQVLNLDPKSQTAKEGLKKAEEKIKEKLPILWEKVSIPEGTFIKGCSEDMADKIVKRVGSSPDNKKILLRNRYTKISLQSFEISKYAVTNEQYLEFVKKTGHRYPSHWKIDQDPPFPKEIARHPVTNISWNDAKAFCEWAGGRLSTSEEWEKAARGTEGKIYPWGDTFNVNKCNTAESEHGRAVAVDEYRDGESPFGVRNMCGNVSEWVDGDGYGMKEFRGGSWQQSCEIYGLTFYSIKTDYETHEAIGFRCAWGPLPPIELLEPQESILIQAGAFYAGCSKEVAKRIVKKFDLDRSNKKVLLQRPYDKIYLQDFEISKYLVTNEEYLKFVDETGHPPPSHWEYGTKRFPDRLRHHPVVNVSWNDAKAFCDWNGVRLPRLEEWEKAARGTDGRIYPWGNTFDVAKCNTAESGLEHTVAVDEYGDVKSPFGVRNLVGNVSEWVDNGEEIKEVRGGTYQESCELFGLPFWNPIRARPQATHEAIGFRYVKDV